MTLQDSRNTVAINLGVLNKQDDDQHACTYSDAPGPYGRRNIRLCSQSWAVSSCIQPLRFDHDEKQIWKTHLLRSIKSMEKSSHPYGNHQSQTRWSMAYHTSRTMINIHDKAIHSLNVSTDIYFFTPAKCRTDVSTIMRVSPIVVYDPNDFTPHLHAFSIFTQIKEGVNRTMDHPIFHTP